MIILGFAYILEFISRYVCLPLCPLICPDGVSRVSFEVPVVGLVLKPPTTRDFFISRTPSPLLVDSWSLLSSVTSQLDILPLLCCAPILDPGWTLCCYYFWLRPHVGSCVDIITPLLLIASSFLRSH